MIPMRASRNQGRRRHSRIARAHNGDVARVIAGRLIELFERCFMFFVNDDEPEVFQRREYRRAGPDDDGIFSLVNSSPRVVTFTERHPAVQRDDLITKVVREPSYDLRREGNFRHEHDGGFLLCQTLHGSLRYRLVSFRFTVMP